LSLFSKTVLRPTEPYIQWRPVLGGVQRPGRETGPSPALNPLNAELNPTCHLLALLGAHHILHISRIRVNAQLPHTTEWRADGNKKLLPSCVYFGAPSMFNLLAPELFFYILAHSVYKM